LRWHWSRVQSLFLAIPKISLIIFAVSSEHLRKVNLIHPFICVGILIFNKFLARTFLVPKKHRKSLSFIWIIFKRPFYSFWDSIGLKFDETKNRCLAYLCINLPTVSTFIDVIVKFSSFLRWKNLLDLTRIFLTTFFDQQSFLIKVEVEMYTRYFPYAKLIIQKFCS